MIVLRRKPTPKRLSVNANDNPRREGRFELPLVLPVTAACADMDVFMLVARSCWSRVTLD